MIKLPENEDCKGICNNLKKYDNENIIHYIKRIHSACELRVNLRGVMIRPCHKLVILSREWAQLYQYENKYFMFRN